MSQQTSFPKNKINILLLEKIHPAAKQTLIESGYSVTEVAKALSEEELLKEIENVHVLGIRSKTKITAKHFEAAKKLLVVGCFGVGTNQVDLEAAKNAGVPVFNAPYSSTRSVAELAASYVLSLARKIGDCNCLMHKGIWKKSAAGSYEVRGKVLGLVGYGHIGQQVGLLAEDMGMHVLYFDREKKLPLGNAKATSTMQDLLKESDFVSLHVPAAKGVQIIGKEELELMKPTSYLINTSRGSLVDLDALKVALVSKTIAGAGLDVFPEEPPANTEDFKCVLAGLENVILTPHIGGSTEEAQENIGIEVAESFVGFVDAGVTSGAVNFPHVNLPMRDDSHRILNIHSNEPGVLSEVNKIISEVGANINAQYLSTFKNIGYLVMDVSTDISQEVKERIAALSTSIKTRILF